MHHYTHTSSLLLTNLVRASVVGNVIKLIAGRYFSSNVHKSGSHQNWFPRYNLVFRYGLGWLLKLSPGWDMKGATWHGQWMYTLGHNRASLKYSPHLAVDKQQTFCLSNITVEKSLNIFYSTKITYKFCLLNTFDYKLTNCQTAKFKNQCWVENIHLSLFLVVEMACCREENRRKSLTMFLPAVNLTFFITGLFILSDLFSHHSQTTTASTRSALFSYWRTLWIFKYMPHRKMAVHYQILFCS